LGQAILPLYNIASIVLKLQAMLLVKSIKSGIFASVAEKPFFKELVCSKNQK